MFVTAPNAYDFGPSLDEAVQEYIKTLSPVAPKLEGRITQGEALAAMAPEAEAQPMAPGSSPCAQDYVVQGDDWLSKVAEKFLGDPLVYDLIFKATNVAASADAKYTVIADPNIIEVGQVLCIPASGAPAEPTAEPTPTP